MLVICSDIHFSDGTLDPFNVPAYAFRIVLDHLKAILERPGNRVKDIEIVLLGDIFDLLRTDQWKPDDRRAPMPWTSPDEELERRVDGILARLLQKNDEALALMTQSGARLEKDVTLRYLPGNHDRALNRFRSTRERLVRALHLDHDPEAPFDLCGSWPRYSLFGEHGDRLDDFNREQPASHSCVGDAFVIHVMNNFFLRTRELLSEKRLEGEERLLAAVQEVDHVRPKWATIVWLRDLISKVRNTEARQALAQGWSSALEGFLALDLDELGMPADPRLLQLLRQLVQTGPSLLENPVVRTMLAESDGAYIRAAQEEIARRHGAVDYVVNGHTHRSRHVPLSRNGDRLQTYFNTGTWRHTINLVQTPDSEARLLASWEEMSFLVFYDPEESCGLPGKRYRYEMWQGMRS